MTKLSPVKLQLFSYPSTIPSQEKHKTSLSPKIRPTAQSYKKLLMSRLSKEEYESNPFNMFNYENYERGTRTIELEPMR